MVGGRLSTDSFAKHRVYILANFSQPHELFEKFCSTKRVFLGADTVHHHAVDLVSDGNSKIDHMYVDCALEGRSRHRPNARQDYLPSPGILQVVRVSQIG